MKSERYEYVISSSDGLFFSPFSLLHGPKLVREPSTKQMLLPLGRVGRILGATCAQNASRVATANAVGGVVKMGGRGGEGRVSTRKYYNRRVAIRRGSSWKKKAPENGNEAANGLE